ncbi:MAG TPA: hypothetical protein VF332_06725 [Vicinamibacterales bacterium]
MTPALVRDDRDHRRLSPRIAIGIALALASSSSYSQQPTFRAGVDVVRVDVSISRGSEHVAGLGAENFSGFDNGAQQKIASVQGAKLEELDQAASAFVDGLVARRGYFVSKGAGS